MAEQKIKIMRNPDQDFFNQVHQAIQDNDGYCICAIEHTPDTKCMCKEFRDMLEGECHCGLYRKIRVSATEVDQNEEIYK